MWFAECVTRKENRLQEFLRSHAAAAPFGGRWQSKEDAEAIREIFESAHSISPPLFRVPGVDFDPPPPSQQKNVCVGSRDL